MLQETWAPTLFPAFPRFKTRKRVPYGPETPFRTDETCFRDGIAFHPYGNMFSIRLPSIRSRFQKKCCHGAGVFGYINGNVNS